MRVKEEQIIYCSTRFFFCVVKQRRKKHQLKSVCYYKDYKFQNRAKRSFIFIACIYLAVRIMEVTKSPSSISMLHLPSAYKSFNICFVVSLYLQTREITITTSTISLPYFVLKKKRRSYADLYRCMYEIIIYYYTKGIVLEECTAKAIQYMKRKDFSRDDQQCVDAICNYFPSTSKSTLSGPGCVPESKRRFVQSQKHQADSLL